MKIKLKPLKDQVVVVFGASSGIGRETALRFAHKGAKVVASARSEEGLQTLVEEIRMAGGRAISLPADASDFAQVKAVADLAVREYGRLDTWVHSAAVAVYAPFTEVTPEEFARIIDVNLTGQAYGAQAALPYLRERGGALIHISSVEAVQTLPLHSAYAASKHGVHGMVEALRMELTHDKVPVSVTEIMPASINTPFFNHARAKIGVKPMGIPPLYEAAIVADAILYAATHPVREMVVGGAGKALVFSQRAAPRATDAFLIRIAYKGQETKEAKAADAPSNLYSPVPGYDRTEGDFGNLSRSHSVDTWFGTHRLARTLLLGATLGGAFLLARRLRGGSEAPPSDGMGPDTETIVDATTTKIVTPVEVLVIEAERGNPPEVGADPDTETSGAFGSGERDPAAAFVSLGNEDDGMASPQEDDPNATQKIYIDRPMA